MARVASVADILSNEFNTINEKDPVSKALGRFGSIRPKPYALVVLDSKKRYKGVVTERDIVRSNLDPHAKVSGVISRVMRRAPTISPELEIPEATRLMIENELKYLPIIYGGKIVGIVRDTDILKKVVKTNFGTDKIEKYLTQDLYTLKPSDTVGSALNLFRQKNISRAPVLDRSKVVGILTMHNIAVSFLHPENKEEKGELSGVKYKLIRFPIKGLMSTSLITCSRNEKVKSIVKKMLKNDITAVIALDNKGNLDGIVTKKDLLESVASLVKPKVQKFFIQVAGELGQLNGVQKQAYSDELQSFVDQYESKFNEGHLYVYLQLQREKTRNQRQFYCKANFTTDKGRFYSGEKGWGAEQALRNSLKELEKQIQKKFGKQIRRTPKKGLYPSKVK